MANLATAEEDLEDGLPQMCRNAKRPLDRDSYQSSADSTGYSEGTSPSESPPRVVASESPSPSDTSSVYRGGSPLYGGSSSSLSSSTVAGLAAGPKFKLLHEGDVQVCRVNRPRTVLAKILSSKLLRRWETHHLILGGRRISSRTPTGFMEEAIAYSHIENVFVESSWDASQKFCIRVAIPDGFVYIQANNAYLRDQWLHSIHWKRNVYKYQNLLMSTRRMEVLIKELKSMVELSMMAPLQDECIHQVPLDIVSKMLSKAENTLPKAVVEDVVNALVPLLEKSHPTPEICDFFSQHCKGNPRSSLVTSLFTPVVQRILKHNMDFGKYPRMRIFVQDYILALNSHNDGHIAVQTFIQSTHGPASSCPHPRVLPNLVSISLAAVYSLFEQHKNWNLEQINDVARRDLEFDEHLRCFITTFVIMSSFEDWRPCLAQLLQPIPFPDEALANNLFNTCFKPVIRNIGTDRRCDVHLMVLGMREGKEGWFHVYCPGSIACDDDGQLWSEMLRTLLSCCCRRKTFLQSLNKMMGSVMLLALRDDVTCQEVISAMLELQVVDNEDHKLQMVTTLQSTTNGKREYAALCDRQMHLKELQQKGGPKKLTLPSRSTDADLAKLLSCGSFGNLECLSLAFTHVTSACADQLIKLPSLRYLNLWSTQFGDAGLQLISEHLQKLQVLNLCETPVTDKGLASLASMKNLRKLNLNSTSLSAHTFEGLKQKLPALQECDVRYTDAW